VEEVKKEDGWDQKIRLISTERNVRRDDVGFKALFVLFARLMSRTSSSYGNSNTYTVVVMGSSTNDALLLLKTELEYLWRKTKVSYSLRKSCIQGSFGIKCESKGEFIGS
jgi:hypothetical protein